MNNILKTSRLDLALVMTYFKRFGLLAFVMPILYTYLMDSIFTGISFGTCMIGILSCYTFSISEKNGMEKLYGILPVSRTELVLGRYTFTLLFGLGSLILTIPCSAAALFIKGVPMHSWEIPAAFFTGLIMFCIYTAVQLPGYYKYGALRAKLFMYIPLGGFFLMGYLFNSFPKKVTAIFTFIINNPIVSGAAAVLAMFLMLLISIMLSIRIISDKEL